MNPIRLAYGSLHHDGAGVLPSQTDGLDYLLLEGGPVLSSNSAALQALLEEALERLGRSFYLDTELSVLASLAGRDPRLVAKGIAEQLAAAENRDLPLGVVRGCDVTDRLEEFLADGELAHQETGQPLLELQRPILKAVVSLGRDALAEALDQHARVVLVGHASVANLAAAAASHHFRAAANRERLTEQAAGLGELLSQIAVRGPQPSAGDVDLFAPPGVSVAMSDDGRVAFFGPSERCGREQQRYGESQPLPATGASVPLTIVYRAGFRANAIVEFDDPEIAATWFGDNWIESPVEQQWTWWRPEAPGRGVLGAAEFRHADRGVVESATRRLRQVVAIAPQSRLVAVPSVVADEKVWPTSVPPDWIEWAVDVRPARDWID